jgi:hypothetical protein
MSLITYDNPTGDSIKNPSLEYLKEIVLTKDADFWKKGSGDSGIEIEGVDERIIFFYDEPYGFFIMRHPDYLAPYDENIKIEVVEHKVGGEPMRIPSCCYVSREKAWEIIREFIETEQIPTNINWTDIYDIDFDHGF